MFEITYFWPYLFVTFTNNICIADNNIHNPVHFTGLRNELSQYDFFFKVEDFNMTVTVELKERGFSGGWSKA